MKPIDYSNFAVFGSIGTIVLLAGVAILMRWIHSQVGARKHADSLTPADLRVLETSAQKLIEDIKETAAIACRDLDDRCEDLRKLILIADQKVAVWSQLCAENPQPALLAERAEQYPAPHSQPAAEHEEQRADARSTVYHLADSGISASDIARELEIPIGEVVLMLSLRTPPAARDLAEQPDGADRTAEPNTHRPTGARRVAGVQGLLG